MITWEEITSTRRWTKASTGKRHTLSSDAIFRRNLFTHSKDIKRELRIFSSSRELGTYYYLLQWITSSSSGKLMEREDFWEHMTGIPRASGKLIWRSKVCQSSNAKILIKNLGENFISASYDRFIKYWDTETGKCISKFTNRKIPYVVKFNPDQDKQHIFLAGCNDKKVHRDLIVFALFLIGFCVGYQIWKHRTRIRSSFESN